MRKFRFHWRIGSCPYGGRSEEASGINVHDAFARLGYGGCPSWWRALERYEEIG